MIAPPDATRDPLDVPLTVVRTATELDLVAKALADADEAAADTETPVVGEGIGPMRVLSVAVRHTGGREEAFVVDARDLDPRLLAPVLSGRTFDAWNADFDARVIENASYVPLGGTAPPVPRWWDGQLADALLHQGQTGFGFYHGLAWAVARYLGIAADGKGTTQLSFTTDTDLTDDQIAYAAADAVETLWVCRRLRAELDAAGLTAVAELEMGARPLLDRMQRVGLGVDWDGWNGELRRLEDRRRSALTALAELTGGGQGSLFDDEVEPAWNPLSERDLRQQLNEHSADSVRVWTARFAGGERLLEPTDSMRRDVVAEIGGPLAEAVLEYRDLAKVLSTYGDTLAEWADDDGRLHPEYLQVVGTNTGRLASRNPNAQNLTPRLKPFVRPGPGRVFAHVDLSQAELRFLAQVTGDEALTAAFEEGADVHVSTAQQMFGVDMSSLRTRDPARFATLRAQAKTINFGIVYGQRGRALARSLTQSGVETSEEEGRRLLDTWLDGHPQVAAWADERDRFIDRLAGDPGPVDWETTLRLHQHFRRVADVRHDFRREHRRWPTPDEVSERVEAIDVGEAAWILDHQAAVVLRPDGSRLGFASRTPAGRRQQFDVPSERLVLHAVIAAVRSGAPSLARVRDVMAERTGAAFTEHRRPRSHEALERVFEDRTLRRAYLDEVGIRCGAGAVHELLDAALADRIGTLSNAYRNAPIQGGVADVMLAAFALLDERLGDVTGAEPVQTVHDSVVVECAAADGPAVAAVVKGALEEAMAGQCPDVAADADADVRTSLSPTDVVTTL